MSARVSLHAAPLGVALRLVDTSTAPDLQRRLATLGLRVGAVVEATQKCAGGGRIISVAGSRVALGAPVLKQLEVEAA